MALTAKQIADLNGSMTAAQNVQLGTVIGALVGLSSIEGGVVTPTSATQTVVTGLDTVTSATVSLSGSPTLDHMWSTVVSGSVAGTIVIHSWKPTSASVATPIAATGSFVAVQWVASGTQL